jgi:cytochrome c553
MFRFIPRICLAAIVVAASSVVSFSTAQAGDAQAGRKKGRVCQTCHGIDGVSRLAEAPNLSGQVETYLVKALQDFKEGRRSNEMMTIVVQPLSEEDIADLAAWYSSIPITVTKPQ